MRKNQWIDKLLSLLLVFALMFIMSDAVSADVTFDSKVTAVFEKDYFESGEPVTMKVILADAQDINAMGYSIKYNASIMAFTSAAAENGFTGQKADADKNEGTLKRILYIPEGGVAAADTDGVVADTITFVMTADGTPSVEFVTSEGDVDFDECSVCVMSKGENIGAITDVKYEVSIFDQYDLWLKGDVNRGGKINMDDISLMLSSYGMEDIDCDITMDGIVNMNDYSILLTNYGAAS